MYGVGCVNDASSILVFLKTGFPLLPLLPRSNLELRDFTFTTLQAAFLYLGCTLAMHYQHGSMEFLCQRFALFLGCAIGERRVRNSTHAGSNLLTYQGEHQ